MTDTDQQQDSQLMTFDLTAAPAQVMEIVQGLDQASVEIYNLLQNIHTEADGERRSELIGLTWQWCEYAKGLAANSTGLTGAALAMAQQSMAKTEEAVTELKTLVDAIEHVDTDHPLLYDLFETLKADAKEDLEEEIDLRVSEAFNEGFGEGADAAMENYDGDPYAGDEDDDGTAALEALIEAIADYSNIKPEHMERLINVLRGETQIKNEEIPLLLEKLGAVLHGIAQETTGTGE